MKDFKLNIACLVLSAILFWSCDNSQTPLSDNFVIEGFIFANEPINNIKIKKINPLISNDSADQVDEPIPDALVILSDGDNEIILDFDSKTGKYGTQNPDLQIISGNTYFLEVTVGTRKATSETVVPDNPDGVRLSADSIFIPELKLNLGLRDEIIQLFSDARIALQWDNPSDESFYVVIEERVNEVDFDAILPPEVPADARELLDSFRFISEPTEETSFDIIGVALQTYGLHVAKVYKVNKEYEDLFNNLEQDSRDLNEPPSNITGALGIFTAFAADSVFFKIVK